MNVSSKTVLTRELKPFEVAFLSTDDPRFLWLKYQILKYFQDWLPLYDFGYANTCRNQIAFKSIATGSARWKYKFESDRTSVTPGKKYKQTTPYDLQAIRYLAIKPTQQVR